jgi:hypothetical protein
MLVWAVQEDLLRALPTRQRHRKVDDQQSDRSHLHYLDDYSEAIGR